MSHTHNVEDFTARTVSLANPLSSVLNERANRFPHSGCLGTSYGSTDIAGGSNHALLLAHVRGAHPISLPPEGSSLLGGSL